MQPEIVQLNALVAETVIGPAGDVVVGGQQVQGCKKLRCVPLFPRPHNGLHLPEAPLVGGVPPHGAGIVVDEVSQPPAEHGGDRALKRVPNDFSIVHHTGLNALGNVGTAAFGGASVVGVLRAESAIHVLRLIFECADKH